MSTMKMSYYKGDLLTQQYLEITTEKCMSGCGNCSYVSEVGNFFCLFEHKSTFFSSAGNMGVLQQSALNKRKLIVLALIKLNWVPLGDA